MLPFSSISIWSDAGSSGRPGIRIISPVMGTTNPAPASISISLTVIRNPVGRPIRSGLSENDFCVFAIQMAAPSSPSFVIFLRSAFAFAVNSTPSAP